MSTTTRPPSRIGSALGSLTGSVTSWFCLTKWENYLLLAVASVSYLAIVVVRADRTLASEARSMAIAATEVIPVVVPAAKPAIKSQSLKAVPRASEPAWRARHDLIKRRAKTDTDILLLGDSITQGWEHGARWKALFPDMPAVNAGISSDRVDHILWRTRDGLFSNARPKVVVLLAGINNLALHSADQIASTHAAIIRQIQTVSPETKILLIGVLPSGASPTHPRRAKIARLNDRLQRLADGESVHFLDIGPRLLETDGTLAKSTAFDSLHLTAKGYKIWAAAMRPKLTNLVGDSTRS